MNAALLDAARGSEVKVTIHNPNGTSREVKGPLLAYDLAAPVPSVTLQAPSKQHAFLVMLGPGIVVTLPYEPPVEHPGLATGPDRVTHPGLR